MAPELGAVQLKVAALPWCPLFGPGQVQPGGAGIKSAAEPKPQVILKVWFGFTVVGAVITPVVGGTQDAPAAALLIVTVLATAAGCVQKLVKFGWVWAWQEIIMEPEAGAVQR